MQRMNHKRLKGKKKDYYIKKKRDASLLLLFKHSSTYSGAW